MKKTVATVTLAGAVLLAGAASASATTAQYPSTPARCGVGAGSIGAGGSVDLTCGGMTPEEQVEVTTACTPAGGGAATTAGGVTNADGRGAITYTAALGTAGNCLLTAVGSGSGATGSATVIVTGTVAAQGAGSASGAAATTTGGTGLANTGADSSSAVWGAAGIGALALGTVVVAVSRRRSRVGAE